MTDESTLLLHAVLDNPGDDTPRAMLADHLMDHGETEFHRYYGRFIACQLAGGYFQEKLWSDTLVGPAALYIKSYAFQMWSHWGDAITPVTYHCGAPLSSITPPPKLHFNRGFVRAVEMTMDEFLRLCLVLFRRHPIEEVRVRNFGFSSSPQRLRWRINVNSFPSTQVDQDGSFYLPVGFKPLLKRGRLTSFHGEKGFGDREYDTESEALVDLSQASVAFARNLERERRSSITELFVSAT